MLGKVRQARQRARGAAAIGFTVIEMMVVVAVAAVVVALAVPSMRDFIARQRVALINAELVTALQLARSESAARDWPVFVTFQTEDLAGQPPMTCYTVHTKRGFSDCDCRMPPGTACSGAGAEELKTVQVLRSTNVTLTPSISPSVRLQFETRRGLARWSTYSSDDAPSWVDFRVDVQSSISGKLRTLVNLTGMPRVCSPDGSIRSVAPCT